MRIALAFILALFFVSTNLTAQSDTMRIIDENSHSPAKATLLSLAVPGLGQAYNKKYWKIPLVYAAIGTSLYFALDQQSKFVDFKDALAKRLDDDPNTIDTKYMENFSDENLRSLIDFHRKNRDLLVVTTAIAYALNVLDAAVDAHLYNFDVSDDISGVFQPDVQFLPQQRQLVPSFKLSLKFGKNDHRRCL
ncbi:MAG: hypothetical protein CMO34_05080 [Verrucomicrobia bacterium]|nr:hypothetical protein [Verrucomicrobiota bacterium]